MSNEALLLTLLSIIGALIIALVIVYIGSVEQKFNFLQSSIDEIKDIIGMRKNLRGEHGNTR